MARLSSQQIRVRNRIQVSISTQDLHSLVHAASQLPTLVQAMGFTRKNEGKSTNACSFNKAGQKKKPKAICCSSYQDSAVNQ